SGPPGAGPSAVLPWKYAGPGGADIVQLLRPALISSRPLITKISHIRTGSSSPPFGLSANGTPDGQRPKISSATVSPGSGRVRAAPTRADRTQPVAGPFSFLLVITTRPRSRVKSRSNARESCRITAVSSTGDSDSPGRLPRSDSSTDLRTARSLRNPGSET